MFALNRNILLTTLSTAVFWLFTNTATAQQTAAPEVQVQHATASIINQLKDTAVEQRDFFFVKQQVEKHLLPIIDLTKVAKKALGKHWKKASPEQKTRFIATFRDLQIKTYTGAFKAFNGQSFEFKPTRYNASKRKAIIVANLLQPGGKPIPIAFKLHLEKETQLWKVYDASIAGISMVKTYRDQLSQQLRKTNLDQIINNMQQELLASNQPIGNP